MEVRECELETDKWGWWEKARKHVIIILENSSLPLSFFYYFYL